MLDEAFYHEFDVERICFDKVFFVVYDEKYCTLNHPFDNQLARKYDSHIFRSRIKGKKYEDVLRIENDYSFWQLQLKGGRTLFVYLNIINYLQAKKHIKIDSNMILKDSNFMPLDSSLTLKDYIDGLYKAIESSKVLYRDLVKKYWNVDLEHV